MENQYTSQDEFEEEFKLESGSCKIFENIVDLFVNEQFCDVTLLSNDEVKVKAHRVILSSTSNYFRAMFCGSFKEAKENDAVVFPEIGGETLTTIISSIYSNKIKLNSNNVNDIIKAAHAMQLTLIVEACSEFMLSHLNDSNAIEIALVASKYNCTNLYESSIQLIVKNFMEIRSTDQFLYLVEEHVDRILSDDNLRVPSEEEVFNALTSWIFFTENREVHLEKLLQRVRTALLHPSFICDAMEQVCVFEKCKELLYKTLKWYLLPEMRSSLLSEEQVRLRSLEDVIIAVEGWEQNINVLRAGLLYRTTNQWIYREWPCPLEKRSNFASTTFNDKLIIAGGNLPCGNLSKQVDCFDFRTLKWTELPPMQTARYYFGMTVLNSELYAVGGCFNGERIRSVEVYNPKNKTWSYLTMMNTGSYNPILGLKDSSLCVSYDVNPAGHKRICFYDSPSSKWINNWLNIDCSLLGMGTVIVNEKKIFVAICKNEIIKVDLKTETIERIPLNVLTEATACKIFQNRFIIYKGTDFQEYNPSDDSFKSLPRFGRSPGGLLVVA